MKLCPRQARRLQLANCDGELGQVIMRGGVTRNLSLTSGLVLFTFAATHFLNHAVGLFNLEAMDQVQQWRLAVTRSLPGMIILAAALFTHIIFGLLKLLRRRTLRLPAWELAQLILGLAIPFLLLPHIVDTHVARVAQRLGLTKQKDAEKIERDLIKLVPREHWTNWSHWLIWHGRRRCYARKPDCSQCEAFRLCPSGKVFLRKGQAKEPAQAD